MNPSTPRAHPRRAAVMAALATLTTLVACGGEGDTTAPASPPVAAPSPAPAPAPAPAPPPVAVPVITTALPTTITVREGDTAPLSVQANSPGGSALSYRWLRNGDELASAGTEATATVPAAPFRSSYGNESWQVEVRNAGGTVLSSATAVTRVNRAWLDIGTAHPEQDYASVGDTGQLLSFIDPAGRVHMASVHSRYEPSFSTGVTLKGHSKDSDTDSFGYSTVIPAQANASVSHLSMASTFSGEIVLAWQERRSIGATERTLVRAALYRPGATAAQAGSWTVIGTLHDSESLEASEPSVVNVGAGAFGIAWLQRGSASQPRNAVMRRYDVPAAGATASSGLGSVVALESTSRDIGRLQLVNGGTPLALMYLQPGDGVPGIWQYSFGNGGVVWSTAADLGLDERFERIYWAEPLNGLSVLAATDGSGQLLTRRIDLAARSFSDAEWEYRSNAFGSPPALLIDGDGRVDVFGVSVNTAAGNTSVIGHWTYRPGTGWGAARILVQSDTNFSSGLGLRNPVAGRDNAGNLVLGWLEKPAADTVQTLRAMRYSQASAAWTTPAPLAPPATSTTGQVEPTLVVDSTGRATAAWADSEAGGTDRVKHARLR
jgi:hypothetical protein